MKPVIVKFYIDNNSNIYMNSRFPKNFKETRLDVEELTFDLYENDEVYLMDCDDPEVFYGCSYHKDDEAIRKFKEYCANNGIRLKETF